MFSEREMYPRRVKMAWSREVCEPSGNEPTASSTLDAVATHEKNDEGEGGGEEEGKMKTELLTCHQPRDTDSLLCACT